MNEAEQIDRDYDLILIGSGMGALTVASLMAQLRDRRVLVIERHSRAGGYTHDFRRGKYLFDTGLHYLGKMDKGSQGRRMMDLITGDGVNWVGMPDPFEKFVYPEFSFDVPSEKSRYIEALEERFPEEAGAIRKYFKDVRWAGAGLAALMMQRNAQRIFRGVAALLRTSLRQRIELTTGDYLDAHFRDPKLKALLASQWGDYGLPPGQSPFVLHAMVVGYYLHGGSYPIGGPGGIAKSVRGIVKSRGGRFLLGHEVTQVLIRDGQAVGVRVRKSKDLEDTGSQEYYAPAVISNAGAANTYLRIIPETQPVPFRQDLKQFLDRNAPTSNLTLFLGLSRDPREAGFNGANHWIYSGLDHDGIFARRGDWIPGGDPESAYLTFPSLKDPHAEAHTAEILSFTDYKPFAQWSEQPWNNRAQEYKRLKERIADVLISFVDRFHPGFSDLVVHREVGTPLTNQHFTMHYQGASYGLPSMAERFHPSNLAWTHPRTPVPGLYMAGADTAGLGVNGAIMGGIMCLGHLPGGLTMPTINKAAARYR